MTRHERDAYRRQLQALAARLTGEVGDLKDEAFRATGGEASGGFSDFPVHPADLANRACEEDVAVNLVRQEEGLLAEVEAALERLEQGTFGTCPKCGTTIGCERLQAVPYARCCVLCVDS